MATNRRPDIAVVGLGPRGLGALEALAARVQGDATRLAVDVFDAFDAPGAGPNFDPRESPVCRLNIPMRDIDIRPPEFSRCGAFEDWLDDAPGSDTFPERATLGRYLQARWDDLRGLACLDVTLHARTVEAVAEGTDGWMLRSGGDTFGPYAEVLLTLGHPEVTPDDQLADWQDHSRQSDGTLAQAYPARQLEQDARGWTGQTVAVRGFALSAFDVLRVLTVGQGGRFETGRYIASGTEPALIAPFSFDGRPPYPKPQSAEVDNRFSPTDAETKHFAAAVAEAAETTPERAQALVSDALLPVVTRILDQRDAGAGKAEVARWLDCEWDDPGAQEVAGSLEALQSGIAMAEGRATPSIGYVMGQVWRKWQNQIRRGYNPAVTPPDTAKLLVGFDEGMKRYSYGPPVSSSRELAALVAAGLVTLDVATDPEIALTSQGWKLAVRTHTVEASVMVDGVLPSPDLSKLRAPLVTGLVRDGRLRAISEGLSADVAADGQLIDDTGTVVPGLSFLGRLALGSVIAADSLHDCFGQASFRWADGAVARLRSRKDAP